MGTILAFTPRRETVERSVSKHGPAASVVIFPGIRYERLTHAEPVASKQPHTERRKRPLAPARP